MCVMFSPRRVRIVLIRDGTSAFAAPIASSTVSPGMNFTTDRRTNAFFVACSRIHRFVHAPRKADLITDMGGYAAKVPNGGARTKVRNEGAVIVGQLRSGDDRLSTLVPAPS